MSLMGTLTKLAIGYATARGVDRLSGSGGFGALLGGGAQIKGQHPASAPAAQMGQALSGQMPDMPNMPEMPEGMPNPMDAMKAAMPDGSANPLAGIMEMFTGGMAQMAGGAGGANPMAAMMEQVQKSGLDLSALMGGGSNSGGKGGLLSALGWAGLAGMIAAGAQAQGQGAAAMMEAFTPGDAAPEAEDMAALMLRAMIQAAKADGSIDAAEKTRILETLGADADAADIAFVQAQLAAPVDTGALAEDTPDAQKLQVYGASLMTIRVDTQAEAEYLDQLARALDLDEPTVNAIHMQMGLQPLYN
ncbi:MAG: tellurite resistance TerB family protein [Pelagimonas sp.]|nr:tellurite resistance TerB family protein [Pelagimonas sp.]